MAKITPPADVRIAALRTKKVAAFDPMVPGGGTPWEDRGNVGTIKAFVLTCVMSMKTPRVLFNSIHRLESSGEAMRFALGCGLMWGIGILLQGLIKLAYVGTRPRVIIDIRLFAIQYGALAVGMIAAAVVLTWLGTRLLHTLLTAEMKTKVPRSLIANIMAYSLGPSLLALIPYVGPGAAAILILVLMVVAATSRLQVTTRGAVTCSIIAFGAIVLIIAVVGFAWWLLGWQTWFEIQPPPAPPVIRYM